MVQMLASKDNKNIKLIRQLSKKSTRHEQQKFVAEGKKIVLEAVRFLPSDIVFVVMSKSFFEREDFCVSEISAACENIYVIPENLFDSISDTDTPQGVLAVMNMRDEKLSRLRDRKEILVLDGVSEPGNMGTAVRTAEALGYDEIYITKGSSDIYSPKTVRASMGSLFRMNFKRDIGVEDILELQKQGFSIIATTPSGNEALEKLDVPKKFAVVIGNEAHGVSDEILNLADKRVKISMDGMAESLNAAVAAGIVMHWLKKGPQKD